MPIQILPPRDRFGGLGELLSGGVRGFDVQSQQRSLIGAARGFGGNAQLAQMLQGLPLNVAQPLFSQAILQQQQARARAAAPLNPLQEAQRRFTEARTQQLGAGQPLDPLEEARRRHVEEQTRQLQRGKKATPSQISKWIKEGLITKEQGKSLAALPLRKTSKDDITKPAFWIDRGLAKDAVQMSQDAARIKAGLKSRASSETNLDKLRKDLAAWQKIQIGTRDELVGGVIPGEEETFGVASGMIDEIRNRIVTLGAQTKASTKYGLTPVQMKQETSGRNGGPTNRLLVRYELFLRSIEDQPTETAAAESLRKSGVPLQAIIKRGTPPIRRKSTTIKRIRGR